MMIIDVLNNGTMSIYVTVDKCVCVGASEGIGVCICVHVDFL